jgi:N-hydroxyarylamine O-acetyltransferase
MALIVAPYLARISYAGPREASPNTLRDLHIAHICAVPFENLDIHRGRPISLDELALFDKIVTRRRGGFCYELNGLFAAVLREMGFEVTLLSAEVAGDAGRYSPEFDHLTLRVDLDEPWLADVGFGDGFRQPLRLSDPEAQHQDGSSYRIVPDGEYRILQRRDPGADWKPQYRFTLQPRALEDFAPRCRFHQTSPDSHFMQNRICTLAVPQGRITLSGMRLIVTSGNEKTERLLSDHEYAAVLREKFGMVE